MNLVTNRVCSFSLKLSFKRGTKCAASFARCCCSTVFVACAIRAARCTAVRSFSFASVCSTEGVVSLPVPVPVPVPLPVAVAVPLPVLAVATSVSTARFASSSAVVMLSNSSSSASCSSS